MALPILPRAQGPIAGQLPTTIEWYNFFQDLRSFVVDNDGDIAQIDSILTRLDALESEHFDPGEILGPASVQVLGTLADGIVSVQFVNDDGEPAARYVYGTDANGLKGWTPVLVENIEGSTYSTLQHFVNTMHSPGIITGGELSDIGGGSVRVSAGTMMIRVLDDDVSSLPFADFAQTDFVVPDDQTTRFFGVVYNAGSPIVEMRSVFDWDKDTEIPLGSGVRLSTSIMAVTPNKYRTGDPITNIIQRADAVSPAIRDASEGGLILGVSGTRNVTLSGGRIWARLSDFASAAKNSSVDTMLTVFFNGTNLTVSSGVTQWDNLQYNNLGTGSLVTLGNNKYANLWFFISIDGTKYGFAYGTNEYNTLGEAANEGVPGYLTQNFFNQTLLLGRFLFQKSAATPAAIESAFTQLFTTQAINNHNDLGGLQGGTTNEFFHFTSAEHTGLLLWAGKDPSDYALLTQTITNGDTTHSPSGDAVFDALATKLTASSVGNGLKIVSGVLSVGESGTEDSTTFLRGDGVWTNSLQNKLVLTAPAVNGIEINTTSVNGDGFGGGAADNCAMFLSSSASGINAGVSFSIFTGSGLSFDFIKFSDAASPAHEVVLNQRNNAGMRVQTNNILRQIWEGNGNWTPNVNGGSASYGGGVNVGFVANATTVPTSNPTGGAIWYVEGGASKVRGSGGTTTTFGPADPHCPECGRDHVLEAENDSGWYQAICLHCLADKLSELGLDKLEGKQKSFITRTKGAWSRHKKKEGA